MAETDELEDIELDDEDEGAGATDADAALDDLDDDLNDDLDAELDSSSGGFLSKILAPLQPILSRIPRPARIAILVVLVLLILGSIIWSIFSGDSEADTATATDMMTPQAQQEFIKAQIEKSKKEQNEKKNKKPKKIKYVILYKALSGTQMSQVLRELTYVEIPFHVDQNGKQYDISVDALRVEEAKNLLAIKGLPMGGVKGYEIFDEASNLGVTEFDKRIRLTRALSGEMEKSIMLFDAVDNAQVEIVMPEERLFATSQPPVTASILLKRAQGAVIGDEVVFAIIQLVANSIENLSPENITVVDTEGHVLSTGLLERVSERHRKEKLVTPALKAASIDMTQQGVAVLPDMDELTQWFEVKYNYEAILERKAMEQLKGVLPVGSYKVAVTTDLNGILPSGQPDIRRIVSSVVIDNAREDIELDDFTTKQIYNAISGAIGYERGRDKILLSRADFLPKGMQMSKAEKTKVSELEKKQAAIAKKKAAKSKEARSAFIKKWSKYWIIPTMGAVAFLILLVAFRILRSVSKSFAQIFSRSAKEKKDEFSSDDFDMLGDEDAPEFTPSPSIPDDEFDELEEDPFEEADEEKANIPADIGLRAIEKFVDEDPERMLDWVRNRLSEES